MLAEAVRQTFERRRTQLPVTAPLALTAVFGHDAVKRTQWRAFLNKANLEAPDLELVVAALQGFLLPVVEGLLHMGTLPRTWQAGGPWQLKAEMAV